MTDEAKRIVEALRWSHLHDDCSDNAYICPVAHECARSDRNLCDPAVAADLIESLSAELEQVRRERDAAVEDVSGYCATCAFVDDCAKHDLNDSAPYCRWFYGDCEDWQWRGAKEGSHD